MTHRAFSLNSSKTMQPEKGGAVMPKLLLVTASVIALSFGSEAAMAQGKGGGGGPPGGVPPTWQGSNPPGFGVEVDRPGWNGNTQPPGWSKAQSSPGWNGGSVPPGLGKKGQ
jgi:hypothetical protein